MVACPMFSNVFPCFPMFSISMNYMRVGRRPLECTKASNLGAWTSRSRTLRIFTRQGSDWAGKSPNFTTASIYAGWWFGTFFIFPYIGNNHPNWLTNIFQRGWTHQPVYIYEYVYTVRILYIIYILYIWKSHQKKRSAQFPKCLLPYVWFPDVFRQNWGPTWRVPNGRCQQNKTLWKLQD